MDLNFQIAQKENELKTTLKKAVFIQKELELLRKLKKLHSKKEEISFSKPILKEMLQNASSQSEKEENVASYRVENAVVVKKQKKKTKKKKKKSSKKKRTDEKVDIIKPAEELQ